MGNGWAGHFPDQGRGGHSHELHLDGRQEDGLNRPAGPATYSGCPFMSLSQKRAGKPEGVGCSATLG